MSKLIFFLLGVTTIIEGVWINSNRVTDWGQWGLEETCPPNEFVHSIKLKVEGYQGDGDDTALNAIKLQCTELEYIRGKENFTEPQNAQDNSLLTSAQGEFGQWEEWQTCEKGVAIGFGLRSEPNMGIRGDDTAANDMKLVCLNEEGLLNTTTTNGSVSTTWGKWEPIKKCPGGHAICGIRTQIERNKGSGDDTSLNNVDLKCCPLPNPAQLCVPNMNEYKYSWFRDRRTVKKDTEETIEFKEGVSLFHLRHNMPETQLFLESITPYINSGEHYPLKLKENFKTNIGKRCQFCDEKFEGLTWTHQHNRQLTITIPAGCYTTLDQLYARCGSFIVDTNEFKQINTCKDRTYTEHIRVHKDRTDKVEKMVNHW